MIFTLATRELKSLFLSPLAWSVLAILQFIFGYLFLGQLDLYIQVQPKLSTLADAPGLTEIVITPMFSNAAMILLLVMPLLTMRLISEEKRNCTLTLLLSAPISITEIIIGKYLSIIGFICILLCLMALMPLSLLLGGNLDFGMVASGFFALFLLLSSFAAIGLYMSTLTNQPVIAAISSFSVILLLWLVDWTAELTGSATSNVMHYLSILQHYQPLINGVFKSSDIVYYLLFITLFLTLSIRRLNAERLQN